MKLYCITFCFLSEFVINVMAKIRVRVRFLIRVRVTISASGQLFGIKVSLKTKYLPP